MVARRFDEVLITGGAVHRSKIDREAKQKASLLGINLESGYQRNTDHRFILYQLRGKYPAADRANGAGLRSRVIWYLYTGEVLVGCKYNIHHKNHNRADDRFCNLEKLSHGEHARLHNPKGLNMVECVCIQCHEHFLKDGWRFREVAQRSRFCSLECYHAYPRSASHKSAISRGMKRAYAEGRL